MRIASLHIHPLKGARAIPVPRANLTPLGLEGDRRWMIIDKAGNAVTQRTHPRLATLGAHLVAGGLRLQTSEGRSIDIERPDGTARASAALWSTMTDAALAADAAHRWLSEFFGEPVRLVYMDAQAKRTKISIWAPDLPVSFADAFPVLVATTASLAALNAAIAQRGGAPVPMARFRPNVVIDCDDPWAEDFWKRLRLGAVELDLVKASDRCVVTTTDQETGEVKGPEPLQSLTRLRLSEDPRIKGVVFAWNAVPRGLGEIHVGAPVEVLEGRPEGFAVRRA